MSNPYSSFSTRVTSQMEPIPGEAHRQVRNSEGGFVYRLDDHAAFLRFLMLGTEGGTFYVGEKELTLKNAVRTIEYIRAKGREAVDEIVQVSHQGRAPKNTPAEFALAIAASAADPEVRSYALQRLGEVCRIPTHLFHFLQFVKGQRGWGRGLKRAVRDWYSSKPVDDLAFSIVKYQQRDGWSHRDVLRKAHPQAVIDSQNAIYKWAVDGWSSELEPFKDLPEMRVIFGFEQAKVATLKELPDLIRKYQLSHEMIPTEAKTSPDVWEALLENMPTGAVIRNLGNLSKCGLLKPFSKAAELVVGKLLDQGGLKRARIHPIGILLAAKTYAQGHGEKGKGTWDPVSQVVDALDEAFYLAFNFVEPTNQRFLVGVDCSQSMEAKISGYPFRASEGAAAMALSIAKVEPKFHVVCFDNKIVKTPTITPKMRLDAVLRETSKLSGSGTDCAVPIQYAIDQRLAVDCFVLITDNETYAGNKHVSQALREYREKLNPRTKLVVIGMTATNMTVGDPNDPGTMNVAGFDASVPQLIQEFAR